MNTQIHTNQKLNGATRIIYFCISALAITICISALALRPAHAASNIDPINHWAWNDVIGWIDFYFTENPNVEVTDLTLNGYASSSVGYISLNCAAGAPGSSCANAYNVVNTNGLLSGWAWNDVIGWISFNCSNTATCADSSYSVRIITGGDFTGWAWNDVIGWISFNCANTATCATVDYKTKTTWSPAPSTGTLTSSIFDTSATNGAAFQTILWQGVLNGGEVKFHLASSMSSGGPWNYRGPDGSAATYYGGGTLGPDTQVEIGSLHAGKRYIRYRIFISTAGWVSPQVDAIVITYTK